MKSEIHSPGNFLLFGVIAVVLLRCGCFHCLHEFVTQGDCKFISGGYVSVNTV